MVQTIYRVAKMASLFASIAASLFFVSIALPHRWIIFQLIVFVILKLCRVKKNVDGGAGAGADYGHLLESWYDDLYPSFHTAAPSDSPSPYEPMPPEVVKEVLLEEDVSSEEEDQEEEREDGEQQDVHQMMVASMDETWMAIMEGRRVAARRTSGTTWERYRRKVEEDVEWATSRGGGARREMVGISEATYEKKDQVDIKAPRQKRKKKDEEGLAVWRRPREVLAVGHEELFRRVEAFIRMQHDHLRLQQRESERRRFLERLQQSS